jgi:hypothetical protein
MHQILDPLEEFKEKVSESLDLIKQLMESPPFLVHV